MKLTKLKRPQKNGIYSILEAVIIISGFHILRMLKGSIVYKYMHRSKVIQGNKSKLTSNQLASVTISLIRIDYLTERKAGMFPIEYTGISSMAPELALLTTGERSQLVTNRERERDRERGGDKQRHRDTEKMEGGKGGGRKRGGRERGGERGAHNYTNQSGRE